jgi:hypothetical protein
MINSVCTWEYEGVYKLILILCLSALKEDHVQWRCNFGLQGLSTPSFGELISKTVYN